MYFTIGKRQSCDKLNDIYWLSRSFEIWHISKWSMFKLSTVVNTMLIVRALKTNGQFNFIHVSLSEEQKWLFFWPNCQEIQHMLYNIHSRGLSVIYNFYELIFSDFLMLQWFIPNGQGYCKEPHLLMTSLRQTTYKYFKEVMFYSGLHWKSVN